MVFSDEMFSKKLHLLRRLFGQKTYRAAEQAQKAHVAPNAFLSDFIFETPSPSLS